MPKIRIKGDHKMGALKFGIGWAAIVFAILLGCKMMNVHLTLHDIDAIVGWTFAGLFIMD